MKSNLSLNEAREKIEFNGLRNGTSYIVHAEVIDVDQNESSTNRDKVVHSVNFETKKCIQPGEQISTCAHHLYCIFTQPMESHFAINLVLVCTSLFCGYLKNT
jgi:hypothetical protein